MRLPELLVRVARNLEFRGLTLAQVGKELSAKEARYKKPRPGRGLNSASHGSDPALPLLATCRRAGGDVRVDIPA